jgi:hypothetical protein
MKKQHHALLAISCLYIVLICGHAVADVAVSYRFSPPVIETLEGGFSRLVFPSSMQAGRIGEPSFPFRGAAVLLPTGEAVASMRIERRGWQVISGYVRLYPCQPPVPGSAASVQGAERRFHYKTDLYARDEWIDPPDPVFETRYLCGHPIATGTFSPVAYNPATGEVGYWTEIDIKLETVRSEESERATRLLRNDEATLARIEALVDNPSALPDPDVMAPPEEEYEYLIIAYEYCEDELEPFRDFYERRGIRTETMWVEDIMHGYTGIDLADQIRQAITETYIEAGITCVLLAGDSQMSQDNLPHRGFYGRVESDTVWEDIDIAADIYYAALDGNWNTDGDTLWGEPGEEDFYSELSIGRITFNSFSELQTIINKTIMYQESPVASQCDNALMLGELLSSNPITWGGDELDQLIGTWDIHGFVTTGIPTSHDIVKYYERDLVSWAFGTVLTEFNSGTHLVCHSGHSNAYNAMKCSIVYVTTDYFTNDGVTANFPVVYTIGCSAGCFAGDDCIGERMVSIETCASAFIGNSSYGWMEEGTTNGASNHYQREFCDAIFTEGITRVGEANVRSKDESVPFIGLPDDDGALRWVCYGLNLLGDPMMDVWTSVPSAIAVDHAPEIYREAVEFAILTDAPGATGALYEGGSCYGTGTAGPQGLLIVELSQLIPHSSDSLELTVTAHDRLAYRAAIAITDELTGAGIPTPRISLYQNSPNPFNPSTIIRFTLTRKGHVDLRAYDVSGREVAVIASRVMEPGGHELPWDAAGLASGIYFYVLRAEGNMITRKAVLLR